MYPDETQKVYSYFECRNGATYSNQKFFGLQYLLRTQLVNPVTQEDLEEAYEISKEQGLPLNYAGWQYILDVHDGMLPLHIKAIPEGMVLPVSNALITIENTDTNLPWLTNYVETMLSRIWYPITIATMSHEAKKVISYFNEQTADNPGLVPFQLHDFGSRGVTCPEQAAIGGMAHLTNFYGTDTVIAHLMVKKIYGSKNPISFSVNATEHSIQTSKGRGGEKQIFVDLLHKYPTGILSVVIDSYDYQNFISGYGLEFKEEILARNGKLVFRPDSGDPVAVSLDVISRLDRVFGSTINTKGYKVLHPQVGMLWGDGIDIEDMEVILQNLKNNGWSSDNIVFGMGGGLLQKVNRDTMRCAFKCSAQLQNGKWVDISKDPLDSTKKSKKGRLKVIETPDGIITVNQNDERYTDSEDLLQTVFLNGEITKTYTLDDIRERNW
jgi:nicotinamide phosphoribosyltransferase